MTSSGRHDALNLCVCTIEHRREGRKLGTAVLPQGKRRLYAAGYDPDCFRIPCDSPTVLRLPERADAIDAVGPTPSTRLCVFSDLSLQPTTSRVSVPAVTLRFVVNRPRILRAGSLLHVGMSQVESNISRCQIPFSARTRPCRLSRAVRDHTATPSSGRRVDVVEDDAMIQHERAVKF